MLIFVVCGVARTACVAVNESFHEYVCVALLLRWQCKNLIGMFCGMRTGQGN